MRRAGLAYSLLEAFQIIKPLTKSARDADNVFLPLHCMLRRTDAEVVYL